MNRRNKMNERIDKEECEELKRCFQFLCDKFHWSIGFRRAAMDGSQTISPNIRVPKNADKNYRDYVELMNSSYFMYSVVVKSISSYRARRTRNTFFNEVVGLYRSRFDSRSSITMNDLLGGRESVGRKFVDELYKKHDVIQNIGLDPFPTEDDPEQAKCPLLRGLKRLITDPDSIVFPRCMISPKCDRLYLDYLSAPIPKFNTLEELKIKMDLNPIETITKEFKIID